MQVATLSAIEGFISADKLASLMKRRVPLVLLDVGTIHAYRAGHITAAHHTAMEAWRQREGYHYRMRSPETLKPLIASLGIRNDTTVIIYGHNRQHELLKAVYVAMALYVMGHDETAILDGGFDAWEFDGSRVVQTGEGQAAVAGDFTGTLRDDLLVDLDYVRAHLHKLPMLEAREPDYYFGRLKSDGVRRAGHIPGAISAYWKNGFTDDMLVLPTKTVRAIFEEGYGIRPDDTVLVYCTGGLEAAMNWYLLHRILGYEKVRVYDASLMEWGNRDDMPMVRYRWELFR